MSFELPDLFQDEDSARLYLESLMWPGGPRCPVCASVENVTPWKRARKRKRAKRKG